MEEPVFLIFDEPTKTSRKDLEWDLIYELTNEFQQDREFDYKKYLVLPNASEAKIRKMHQKYKDLRAVTLKKKGQDNE